MWSSSIGKVSPGEDLRVGRRERGRRASGSEFGLVRHLRGRSRRPCRRGPSLDLVERRDALACRVRGELDVLAAAALAVLGELALPARLLGVEERDRDRGPRHRLRQGAGELEHDRDPRGAVVGADEARGSRPWCRGGRRSRRNPAPSRASMPTTLRLGLLDRDVLDPRLPSASSASSSVSSAFAAEPAGAGPELDLVARGRRRRAPRRTPPVGERGRVGSLLAPATGDRAARAGRRRGRSGSGAAAACAIR